MFFWEAMYTTCRTLREGEGGRVDHDGHVEGLEKRKKN